MHRLLLASCLVACTARVPASIDPVPTEAEPTKAEPTKSEPAKSKPANSESSQLLGVMQTFEALTLQVRSEGCRESADVRFAVIEGELTIDAIAPETCEDTRVLGAPLRFAWSELPAFAELGFELGPVDVLEPGPKPGPSVAPERGVDEPLYGVLVGADGIDVRVSSGGCTVPEHFTAFVEPGEIQLVHLIRLEADSCEADLPEGELLHFTWAQLGVTAGKARVVNRIEKLEIQ
ncbi:hypothetical protein ACNOYE_14520 [Nannocystaceae bacterium ST9]